MQFFWIPVRWLIETAWLGPVPIKFINESCTDRFSHSKKALLHFLQNLIISLFEHGRLNKYKHYSSRLSTSSIVQVQSYSLHSVADRNIKRNAGFPPPPLLPVWGDVPQEMCGLKLPVDNYSLFKGKNTNRGEVLSEHHSCRWWNTGLWRPDCLSPHNIILRWTAVPETVDLVAESCDSINTGQQLKLLAKSNG